jgi:hypothetical protein
MSYPRRWNCRRQIWPLVDQFSGAGVVEAWMLVEREYAVSQGKQVAGSLG